MAHPIGQCLAFDLDALAGIDIGLAIERKAVAILGDRDMGHHVRSRAAFGNRQIRAGRLEHRLTGSAGDLRADIADHFELNRDLLQDLGLVFADLGEFCGIAAAAGDHRLERYGLAREMGGQRLANRWFARWLCAPLPCLGSVLACRIAGIFFGLELLEFFQHQFKLGDLSIELL